MSNEPRKRRTNSELRDVTNRLFYEWKMLAFCAEELDKIPTKLLENAFIESGAIHSRILVTFFYPFNSKNGPKRTDAIANDFFSESGDWENISPPISNSLNYPELGGHTDLQIAHIVYAEGDKEPFVAHGHYKWQFTLIADALQPVFEKFIATISKETLGDRWVENLDEQEGLRWENLKAIVTERFRN